MRLVSSIALAGAVAGLMAAAPAAQAQQAFVLTDAATNNLMVIDLSTGAEVGSPVSSGVPLTSMTQLGDGFFYAENRNTGVLYSLQEPTGVTAPIGTAATIYNLASTTTGMYGMTVDLSTLLSVNRSTGAATSIGSGTFLFAPVRASGLSSAGTNLYALTDDGGGGNSFLCQIFTGSGSNGTCMDTGTTDLSAMTTIGGTLYAVNNVTKTVWTIDEATGVATQTAADLSSALGSSNILSIAPATPVPEAQTYIGMLLGLAGLGWAYRRQR